MILNLTHHLGLLAAIIAGSLAILCLLRGLLLGYPPPALPGAVLTAKEQAVLSACADALLPHGGALPLSATEAGVVPYFDRMMRELPRKNRQLIRLLLAFLEHGPWLFGLRSRLTAQTPEGRVRTLRAWSRSRIYFLRTSFLSARTLLAMAYLSNAKVAERLGALPNLSPFAKRRTA